jgi:hypothetical protein
MDYWKGDPLLELEHTVWDPTPWVIDIYSPHDALRTSHICWLRENIGKESWPLHGEPGDWHFGGATVQGQVWLGFKTEEMMQRFCNAFPENVIIP